MQPFTTVTGAAAPLMRANVDTDVIIRIERLAGAPREQLGSYAFEALRYRKDGSETPDFVLNRPAFRGAPILLAGDNFGCGSSREGAVWALMAAGLRCVIAPSFGDIFYNNCFQNGMLPVVLPASDVELLSIEAAAGAPVTVDLAEQVVMMPSGQRLHFDIDLQRRQSLLEGMGELTRTVGGSGAEITQWQSRDRVARPWIWVSELDDAGSAAGG